MVGLVLQAVELGRWSDGVGHYIFGADNGAWANEAPGARARDRWGGIKRVAGSVGEPGYDHIVPGLDYAQGWLERHPGEGRDPVVSVHREHIGAGEQHLADKVSVALMIGREAVFGRSEERRVGKEGRSRW